ncbi:RHS repeat-associated core domain-containing protein [Pseudomonas sp. YuFO8]|uniref:RHS repeat-associated core domain-containing protein n=1 Tax=Pseudomonas sp. YuFO8 TaxID=3095361 RepID=UPI002B249297|nr:RHS repeat-associated core domain-containing protein [Pseudomonas sp. YuFO8]MEB2621197.1 RHS repeat-associated core domain-containing protein [Pseudomonas sp. YuFO8]
MSAPALKILRRYVYDPLDRIIGAGLLQTDSTQRFYQEDHLTTELGQQTQRTILRHQAQPLAQSQNEAGVSQTTLLATDQAHSLMITVSRINPQQFAYCAYGHHPVKSGLSALIGFNGECPDATTGHYPLGQGNRFFNPVLMRFNSPDELSPFSEGGINPYAYCGWDPINFGDPTGNSRLAHLKALWRKASQTADVNRASVTTATSSARANAPTPNAIGQATSLSSGSSQTKYRILPQEASTPSSSAQPFPHQLGPFKLDSKTKKISKKTSKKNISNTSTNSTTTHKSTKNSKNRRIFRQCILDHKKHTGKT